MPFEHKFDIRMTLDGDLVVDGNGDFKLTNGFDWLAREFNKRLRTDNPEWRTHPGIGAGLMSYIGRPNDAYTGKLIKEAIEGALRDNELIGRYSVSAEIIPVNVDAVQIYIYVDISGSTVQLLRVIIDFRDGVSVEPTDNIAEPITETKKGFQGNRYLGRIR